VEDDDIAQRLENLLQLAQKKYLNLSSQNKWSGVGTPGKLSFISKPTSWNCGADDLMADKCPKPKNEAAIECNHQSY